VSACGADGEVKCRKSIEGAGACWAASFIACALVAANPHFPPAAAFAVSQVRLCAYVATLATLVDTVSSRTTDAALMVLSAALVVVGCFWYDWDAW
jgi:dolichol kinase